jgi:site-specific recombinase XerD
MTSKFTKSVIDRAQPKAKPYELHGQHGLIVRVQPSGRKTFYCLYARGRRQRIGDATVITLDRAEYRARQILNEAHDFGDPLKRDLRKSTFGGFVQGHYAPWLKANRRGADKTLKDIKRCFDSLYLKKLTDITRSDLDRYVAKRRTDGCATATIVRDMNNLRSVVRRAIDGGYLRDSPFKGWEKPKVVDRGVTRYLSTDEEKALREAMAERDDKARRERVTANDWRRQRGYELLSEFSEKDFPDHLSPMVLVSLNSGLRYGELTGLAWSAIDLRAQVLTVTGATSKGAKTRHVPLNAEALDVLVRWKAQGQGEGLVFKNHEGAAIGTVKTAWLALLKDAKINDFRWHDLRHTFASKLVQRGVDLAVVRELLGHGDFALTLRYAHLEPKQKADAVARLAA